MTRQAIWSLVLLGGAGYLGYWIGKRQCSMGGSR